MAAAEQLSMAIPYQNTLQNILSLKERIGTFSLNSVYINDEGLLGIKNPPTQADYSFDYHGQLINLKIQSAKDQSILQIWAPIGEILYTAECGYSRRRSIDIINSIPVELKTKYVITDRQKLMCLYETEIDHKTWTDDMIYMAAQFIKKNEPYISLLRPVVRQS